MDDLQDRAQAPLRAAAHEIHQLRLRIDDAVRRKTSVKVEGKTLRGEAAKALQGQVRRLDDLFQSSGSSLLAGLALFAREQVVSYAECANWIDAMNQGERGLLANLKIEAERGDQALQQSQAMLADLGRQRDALLAQKTAALPQDREQKQQSGPATETAPATAERPDVHSRQARLLGEIDRILDQSSECEQAHSSASTNWIKTRKQLRQIDDRLDLLEAELGRAQGAATQSLQAHQNANRERHQQIDQLRRTLGDVSAATLRADRELAVLIAPSALDTALTRHLGRSPEQLQQRFLVTGAAATYATPEALLRALVDVSEEASRRFPGIFEATTPAQFDAVCRRAGAAPTDLLCRHDDVVGHGVNRRDGEPVDTLTSCYSLEWNRNTGQVQVSHLYPYVPRRG